MKELSWVLLFSFIYNSYTRVSGGFALCVLAKEKGVVGRLVGY